MPHNPSRKPGIRFRSRCCIRLMHATVRIALWLTMIVSLQTAVSQRPAAFGYEATIEKQLDSLPSTQGTRVTLFDLRARGPKQLSEKELLPLDLPDSETVAFMHARQVLEKVYGRTKIDEKIGWHDINSDGILDVFSMANSTLACGSGGCAFNILVSWRRGKWKSVCGCIWMNHLQCSQPSIVAITISSSGSGTR